MSGVFFEPLAMWHDTASFRSGATFLDWHLETQAPSHEQAEASRTLVLVAEENAGRSHCPVEGYITLEAGTMPTAFLRLTDADSTLIPLLPDTPINERVSGVHALAQLPIVYLSFLARHERNRGAGYGDLLLMEALRRTELVSVHVGIAGLFLVSTTEGVALYERYGFRKFDDYDRKLFLSTHTIRQTLAILDAPET